VSVSFCLMWHMCAYMCAQMCAHTCACMRTHMPHETEGQEHADICSLCVRVLLTCAARACPSVIYRGIHPFIEAYMQPMRACPSDICSTCVSFCLKWHKSCGTLCAMAYVSICVSFGHLQPMCVLLSHMAYAAWHTVCHDICQHFP
jgi:hypothetical protein